MIQSKAPVDPPKPKYASKNAVYKYLSHHYVLKRSVVFIVDSDFSSEVHKEKAHHYLNNFFEKMELSDYFGFIGLSKSSNNDEIVLEEKGRNPYIKQIFLNAMKD